MDAQQPKVPEMMTVAEVIAYLRLDVDDRDPAERLRNLVRYQGLPMVKRSRLQVFRWLSIDAWLAAGETGAKFKRSSEKPKRS